MLMWGVRAIVKTIFNYFEQIYSPTVVENNLSPLMSPCGNRFRPAVSADYHRVGFPCQTL